MDGYWQPGGGRHLIAHRGASLFAPENSPEAVREAAARGATDVEVDVNMTADGVLLAVHDGVVAGADVRWISQMTEAEVRSAMASAPSGRSGGSGAPAASAASAQGPAGPIGTARPAGSSAASGGADGSGGSAPGSGGSDGSGGSAPESGGSDGSGGSVASGQGPAAGSAGTAGARGSAGRGGSAGSGGSADAIEGPARLDDVLAVVAEAGLGVYLDVKQLLPGGAAALGEMVRSHGLGERAVGASFRADLAGRLKTEGGVATSLLFHDPGIDIHSLARGLDLDFVHPCYDVFGAGALDLLTPEWVAAVRAIGVGIVAWNTLEVAVAAEVFARGADGVCSDDPAVLVEAVATLG